VQINFPEMGKRSPAQAAAGKKLKSTFSKNRNVKFLKAAKKPDVSIADTFSLPCRRHHTRAHSHRRPLIGPQAISGIVKKEGMEKDATKFRDLSREQRRQAKKQRSCEFARVRVQMPCCCVCPCSHNTIRHRQSMHLSPH
jgi:hypothetical protein